MKKLITSIFVLVFATTLFAINPIKDKADSLYTAGNYIEALASYQQVLDQGLESADLYFNLGNTHYKLGQIPNAILNYERALRLKPFDKDVQYNLELTQQYTVDKIDAVDEFFMKRWLKEFRQNLTSDGWSRLSIALFVLVVILALIFFFAGGAFLKRVSFYLGSILLFGVFVSVWAAASEKSDITNNVEAIVFSPSVTIKGSPDNAGTDLFILHEGAKVSIIDSVGDWRRIQMLDGNVGWLLKKDFEEI